MAWLDRLSSTFKRQGKGEQGDLFGSKVPHTFKLTLTTADNVPDGFSACRILVVDQKNKHSFISPAAKVSDAHQESSTSDWPAGSVKNGSVSCTWQEGHSSVQLRGKLKPQPGGGWQQRDIKLILQLQKANFIGTWMDLGNPITVNLAAHAPPQPAAGSMPFTSPMDTPLLLVWDVQDPKPCSITVHAYLTCIAGDYAAALSNPGAARQSLDVADDMLSLASSSGRSTPRTSLSGAATPSSQPASTRHSGTAATVEPSGPSPASISLPHMHSGRVAPSDVPLMSHKSAGGGPVHALHPGSGRIVPIPPPASGRIQPDGQLRPVMGTLPIPVGTEGHGRQQVPNNTGAGMMPPSPTSSLRSMPPLEVAESEMSTPRSLQFGMSHNASPERARQAGDTQQQGSPHSSASDAASMPPLEVGTESAASSFAAPVGMYMPKSIPGGPMGAGRAAASMRDSTLDASRPPVVSTTGVAFPAAHNTASNPPGTVEPVTAAAPRTAVIPVSMPAAAAAASPTAGTFVVPHSLPAAAVAVSPALASIGEEERPSASDVHTSKHMEAAGAPAAAAGVSVGSPSAAGASETPGLLPASSHSVTTTSGSATTQSVGSPREQLAAILQSRKTSGAQLPRALQQLPHLVSRSPSSASTSALTAADVNAVSYTNSKAGQLEEDLVTDWDTPLPTHPSDSVMGADAGMAIAEYVPENDVSGPVEVAVVAQGPAASALHHQLHGAAQRSQSQKLDAVQAEGSMPSGAENSQSTDMALSSSAATDRNLIFVPPDKPLVGSLDALPALTHAAAAPTGTAEAAAGSAAGLAQPVTGSDEKGPAFQNALMDVSGPLARLRAANAETTASLFSMESPNASSKLPTAVVGPAGDTGTDSLLLWVGGGQPGLGGGYGAGGGEGGELSMAALNELGTGAAAGGAANPALLVLHEAHDETDGGPGSRALAQQPADQVDFGSRDLVAAGEAAIAGQPMTEGKLNSTVDRAADKILSKESLGGPGDGSGVVLDDPVHAYATPPRPSHSNSSSGPVASRQNSPIPIEEASPVVDSPARADDSAAGQSARGLGPRTPQASSSGRRSSYSAAAVANVDLQEGMVPFARRWVMDTAPELAVSAAAPEVVATAATPELAVSAAAPELTTPTAVGEPTTATAAASSAPTTAAAAASAPAADAVGSDHVSLPAATDADVAGVPAAADAVADVTTAAAPSGTASDKAVQDVMKDSPPQSLIPTPTPMQPGAIPALSDGGAAPASSQQAKELDPQATVADVAMAIAGAPIVAMASGQQGPGQAAALAAQLELAHAAVNRMLDIASATAAEAAAAVARSDRMLAALDGTATKVKEADQMVDEMVGTAQATMAEAAAQEAHADRVVAALEQPVVSQVQRAEDAVQGMLDTAQSTAAKAAQEESHATRALAALDQPQAELEQVPQPAAETVPDTTGTQHATYPVGIASLEQSGEAGGVPGVKQLRVADAAVQEMLDQASSTAAMATAAEARADREVAAWQQPVDAKLQTADVALQAMLQQASSAADTAAAQEARVDCEVAALQQPVDAKLREADAALQAMLDTARLTAGTAAAQEARTDRIAAVLAQPDVTAMTSPYERPLTDRGQTPDSNAAAAEAEDEGSTAPAEGYLSAAASWAEHMDSHTAPQLAPASFIEPGDGGTGRGTAVTDLTADDGDALQPAASGGMIGWLDNWVHGLTSDLQQGVHELMAVVHSHRAARLPMAAGGHMYTGPQVFLLLALLHRAIQLPMRQAVLGLSVMLAATGMALLHAMVLIATRPFSRRR